MHIEQLYTGCLAQAAYYIESDGVAAIIDPLRDYEQYIDKAKSRNATIKYVFETHFHADFVSGHIDLAGRTGATIVYGPKTSTAFPVHVANDNEEIQLGKITIRVLHTPGHTPESTCFLLLDEKGEEYCVFSGDTLFVGDVGRPDLLDGVMSKEELASMMYESLHTKLMPLKDATIVYPAHGAGSACGKNIGKETWSTIGEQKKLNYALQPMSKEQFVKTITEGISPAPAYFFKDAVLNKKGYDSLENIVKKGMQAFSIEQCDALRKEGIVLIDTRNAEVFEQGFIPGSINIGLNGQFAIWAANLFDLDTRILLVTDESKEKECIERLARVGFDNIIGYVDGGFEKWKTEGKRYDMVISVDEEEFELDVKHTDIGVLDVRKVSEFNDLHLTKAMNFPLDNINKNFTTLDPDKEYLIHCAGGYRSMVATSYLKSKGFQRVKNVLGGFSKIKNMKLPFSSN